MTSIKYPDFRYDPATGSDPTGPTYTYSYDQMGRPLTLTGGAYVSGVTYGPAGELTSINGETRTYNEQKQLTGINVPGLGSITYSFSSTNNNGRITGMTNTITGESVTYAYDSLNRLISASAGGQWGLSFSYDGFGNRLSQNVTAGSAPTIQQSYDMTTNRLQGQYYDANGNMGGVSWDVENRLLQIQGQTAPYSMEFYDYGIDNKRIYKQTYLQSGNPEEVYFYVAGRKIATYTLAYLDITGDGYPTVLFTQPKYNVYFGSRLMIANGQNVVLDRLGSVVWDGAPHSYFPYGEERTPTANNKNKFATYFRDASTGLDYADQRFYSSTNGRFNAPDPYRASGNLLAPFSWNRFSFVEGDPVNFYDPEGLCKALPEAPFCFEITTTGTPGLMTFSLDVYATADDSWYPRPNDAAGAKSISDYNRKVTSVDIREWDDVHPNVTAEKLRKLAACSAIPDAGVQSMTVTFGAGFGQTFTLDVVSNYNTGTVSVFSSMGINAGWTGGGMASSAQSGYAYGVAGDNSNYAGYSTSINGGYRFAAGTFSISTPQASNNQFSLYPTSNSSTTTISLGVGVGETMTIGALFVTQGSYSMVGQLGSLQTGVGTPGDQWLYVAKQAACK